MANITANQLFHSTRITRSISRVKVPQTVLSDFWKMNLGGSNVNPVGGDVAAYDIFDKTRALATGRARGSGPAVIQRQKAGQKTLTMMRYHEKLTLLDDEVFRRRPIGGDYGQANVDVAGQKYVAKQEEFLGQRFKNVREFMVSRMLTTGKFGMSISGQDLIPVEAGSGTFDVDFQMPAGNLSQLNMLGAGNIIGTKWPTAATATPITDCLNISAAMEQLAGYPLRHVFCNSKVWMYVIKTTEVINLAGSAASPFEYFRRAGETNQDGIETDYYEAILKGLPTVIWHIVNAGLEVNGTFTKTLGDTKALFLPEPSNDIAEYFEGSEMVRENVQDNGSERMGFHAWTTPVIDPAGRDLKALDKGIPVAYKPDAWACGTIDF